MCVLVLTCRPLILEQYPELSTCSVRKDETTRNRNTRIDICPICDMEASDPTADRSGSHKSQTMQTGCEVAAEAKTAGAASVTLVHSLPHLMSNEKHGKVPLQRLKKIGVVVILGERAEPVAQEGDPSATSASPGPGQYKIGGEAKSFDLVFKCVGFKQVHGSFITPLGDVLDAQGSIVVNESFQVRCMHLLLICNP